MYRLLIVDDEELIVNWLRKLFQDADELDLDISIAYSGDMIFDIQESDKTKNVNELITKIKQYVSYHLKEELSLTTLAEHVYLYPSYLSRLFKQFTGGNLKDYILSIRLGKAKELLKNKDLKIHEVATAVGFGYSNYFTNFFKKKIGITPQEFRDTYTNR